MGAFGRQNEFSFLGIIPRNVISENNFLEHDILGVFGVQIEFLRIFNKFSKIPLIEGVVTSWSAMATVADGGRWWCLAAADSDCGRRQTVIGGGWLWVVIGVF